jgi:V/A-type H+-transporting ATPase subunit E
MPGLEHLVDKIVGSARDEARRIADAGREEAASIVAGYKRRAQAEKAAAMGKAAQEAAAAKARIISAAELEARDKKLAAKQQLIDRALGAAVQKLNGMGDGQYAEFLAKQLGGVDLPEGSEAIIPKRYRGKVDLKAINPRLRLSESDRQINGGFVLVSPETESDNTFEALASQRRGELERLVVERLF